MPPHSKQRDKIMLRYWAALIGLTSTFIISDVDFLKKIQLAQDKTELLWVDRFTVIEDDHLIVPDRRDASIKIFDKTGTFVSAFGRKGDGPGEFRSPSYCANVFPYLVIYDFSRGEVMRFKKKGVLKFEYENSQKGILGVMDLCIWKDRVIIAGYKKDNAGKDYDLYSLDMKNGAIEYLLPSYMKYGFKSEDEYHRSYGNIIPLGLKNIINEYNDNIFHAWEHRLKIIRINLSSKRLIEFGQKTDNYHEPYITKLLRKSYDLIVSGRDREASRLYDEELRRFSRVFGVFGDEKICGVLYQNYDKKESMLKPFLQIYDYEGKFLNEYALKEVRYDISDKRTIPYFYDSGKKTLYLMSQILQDDSSIKYEIIQYRIQL
jgi:hypothetical protein